METPLVVFAGRSNVGKSSTIRALTGMKIRVGKKPGSTRWELMIDLGPVTLVDIPGFGHMSGVSKTGIEEMKTTIVQKLEDWSDRLAFAVLIVDISLFRELVERWEKRGEIPIDVEFYTFLSEIAPQVIVAANKIDKLKKRQQSSELQFLRTKLREALPEVNPNVVPLSALKKQGILDLKHAIEAILLEVGLEKPEW
ncbi:MAG: GTP-binding protein EngB [Candidatus Thorarchaeota archaeon]|jgi:GTP-binding protein EngB required for normal cell division